MSSTFLPMSLSRARFRTSCCPSPSPALPAAAHPARRYELVGDWYGGFLLRGGDSTISNLVIRNFDGYGIGMLDDTAATRFRATTSARTSQEVRVRATAAVSSIHPRVATLSVASQRPTATLSPATLVPASSV